MQTFYLSFLVIKTLENLKFGLFEIFWRF